MRDAEREPRLEGGSQRDPRAVHVRDAGHDRGLEDSRGPRARGEELDAKREPLEPGGATWTAMLPAGEHWVAAVTNSKAGVAVNLWGWASASAINALGGLATGLMLLIYFEVRVRRIVRRRA